MEIFYDYFFLNDMCAVVNCIGRLSLLDMNWIVCTKLTIISVRNCINGHFDPSDKKKGGDICYLEKKQFRRQQFFSLEMCSLKCSFAVVTDT